MELNSITSILRELKVMAFYKDVEYHVDMSSFKSFNNRMKSYLNEYDLVYTSDEQKIISQDVKDAIENFKTKIEKLSIPVDDFDNYLRTSRVTPAIQKYFDIKKELTYNIIPIIFSDNRQYPVEIAKLSSEKDKSKTDIEILNHNNPFADITIQNQKFLYPDSNKDFQTLEFNVGYTMSKVEEEDSAALVVQPDFKISKSRNRNQFVNTITMDNTIATPMPETQGTKELLYI